MAIFKKPAIKAEGGRKREIPRGLFQKCPGCSEVVPEIELAQNQRVCPRCEYHFAQPAGGGFKILFARTTLLEWIVALNSLNSLRFQGLVGYKVRFKNNKE